MAGQWSTFRRFLSTTEKLVFSDGPRLIRRLQDPEALAHDIGANISQNISGSLRLGIDLGLALLAGLETQNQPKAITAGRPITETIVPTSQRARQVVYAPDLNGRADPGEVVWTWVVYEDDPTRGTDRPVLVVGREHQTLLGLMLSSQDGHGDDANWISIGVGNWDYEGRASWVRLDRVLDVPEESIRREGAVLARDRFEVIAAALRTRYAWR